MKKDQEFYLELGRLIERRCKGKGWSLSYLARMVKVPKSTLHGWVSGRRPNMAIMLEILNAIDLHVEDIRNQVMDNASRNSPDSME